MQNTGGSFYQFSTCVCCQNSDRELVWWGSLFFKESTGMGKGWVCGPSIGSKDQRTNLNWVCFGKEPTLNCWFFQKFPKPGTKIKPGTRHCLILKIFKNPEPDIITKSKNYPILKLNITLSSLITSELQPLTSSVFSISKFLQKFDLKNVISTSTKDFSWEKWSKFAKFQKEKNSNHSTVLLQ
jgi:hypothetical protein